MGNIAPSRNNSEEDSITSQFTTKSAVKMGTRNPSKPDTRTRIQNTNQGTNASYESLCKPLVANEDDVLDEKIKNLFGEENPRPWLFSQPLFNSDKWQQVNAFSYLEMTSGNKNGFDDVYDFVTYLWERHAVKKYHINKINAIKNLHLQQIWERQIGNLEIRNRNPKFKVDWNTYKYFDNRQRVMNRISKYIFKYENVYIMPVFHSPNPEAVVSICETGFANIGTTDDGFFGKGVYATPQSDYAASVYGQGICFLCFVCFFNPFPVVDSDEFVGAGNVGKADVHFVSVCPLSSRPDENNYFAAREDQEPVYDEIVVFQESQIIPRYLIYYDK